MGGMIYGERTATRQRSSQSQSFPAPTAGWNARDSLTGMQPNEAVRMDNFFPSFGRVEVRKGYTSFATGLGGTIKTLAEFNAGSTRKMIGCAGGSIFDVSSAGAVGAALASSKTSDEWQCAQFDDSAGGARLGMVNGADDPVIYNGSTVAAMTLTGPTKANVIGIHIHKSRSYFWEKDSQSIWYSAVNALGGACTEFKLGRLSGWGGNLLAMESWSRDGGAGPADYAVFISSSGDVIVYLGTSPADSDWALVGMYRVGEPIGRRSTVKVANELYIISKAGYVAMSQIVAAGDAANVSLSDRIRGEVLDRIEANASTFGWQAVLYPRGNYMMVNVPYSATLFHQHVVNITSGAWCRFTGQNFYSWCVFNGRLYAGGSDGKVYLADEGHTDNGNPIQADVICAWNYLGNPGTLKRINMARFVGRTPIGSVSYAIDVQTDFDDSSSTTLTTSVAGFSSSIWDTSLWDKTAWSEESQVLSSWGGSGGLGDAVAARLRVSSKNVFEWFQTTFIYTVAGPL